MFEGIGLQGFVLMFRVNASESRGKCWAIEYWFWGRGAQGSPMSHAQEAPRLRLLVT